MSEMVKEIELRRARRALSDKAVPQEVVERIMTAATWAPSCFNNQPWRFVVVRAKSELETVKGFLAGGNYWARKSPLIVVVLTEPELDCRLSDRRDYSFFSTGLAVENLVLQAFREGLIAHPIAGYKPEGIKEALGIPQELVLLTLVIIGYPGDEAHLNEKHLALEHSPRDRKPPEEVIRYDRWS
ncbi:MAG: nitroreductase family protein [Spirochaetales bacterium]|nr:nitroreductase family protein [Spirochaetales bacterium]